LVKGFVSDWIGTAVDHDRRLTVVVVVAVLLGVFALLIGVRWRDAQPLSGDEPHYLLVSESLVRDGDVDVKNDYLDRRYRDFSSGDLQPHVNASIFTPASRHWYSMHGVGLSAVLVPAFWINGAQGATVAMIFVAVIVLVLTFLWVQRFTGEAWSAAIATGAIG